jgi:hypothetical protein
MELGIARSTARWAVSAMTVIRWSRASRRSRSSADSTASPASDAQMPTRNQ